MPTSCGRKDYCCFHFTEEKGRLQSVYHYEMTEPEFRLRHSESRAGDFNYYKILLSL
jgi:hypothetical protein